MEIIFSGLASRRPPQAALIVALPMGIFLLELTRLPYWALLLGSYMLSVDTLLLWRVSLQISPCE